MSAILSRVLIVEDEEPAADRLIDLVRALAPDVTILGPLPGIRDTVSWLGSHPAPDLILLDISLSDGSSFAIFEQAEVRCPVIFTTAYDVYWQQAFAHNGLDYLLKPIRRDKLAAALARYDQLSSHFRERLDGLRREAGETPEGYRRRMLVKRGVDWFSLRVEDIAYFMAADKAVILVDRQGQRFVLDQSLQELERQLDPDDFYRVNRKCIVRRDSIVKAKSYSKSKLLLDLDPPAGEEVIVSQEASARFKAWYGG